MTTLDRITTAALPGLQNPVSRLILGCDNKLSYEDGAPIWDHWMALGGNAFDTAWVYGGGQCEKALGEWIAKRGLVGKITVIVKGAHTPHCTPEAISAQLTESLDRLQLDTAPIYIMHRDDPLVPVGEFVDALNAEQAKGRIGIFGGSNWRIGRIELARIHAQRNGRNAFSVLNNNLSLATMEKPVWDGCISSRDLASMKYLRTTGLTHVSWSSQARGYFLPEDLRNRLPEDTRPETCFGSVANAARRGRAEQMAKERGVSANNIALAWVLAQPFPSFALVGPRTVEEIDTSVSACAVDLSAQDVRWLDEGA